MLDNSTKAELCAAVDSGFDAQLEFTADAVCYGSLRETEPPPTKVEGFSVFGAPSAQSYILFRLKSEVSNQLVENERGVQECMAARLGTMGYEVDHWRIADEDIREHPGYSPLIRNMDQAFNTVGVLKCDAPIGHSLIINGHVDTVPVGPLDMWEHPPFEPVIKNGWVYGRAAGDMKAGLVAGIYAIQAIRAAGFRPGAEICVQSVIEEESTGAGALACLARGYSADLAFVPEPFGERLVRAQVGVVWCRISLLGNPAHAAYAQSGANAIDAAYRVIAGLRELESALNAPERRHPVYADFLHPINLNIGGIRGGEWPSSVPCTCEVDVRCCLHPGQSPASLQAEIVDCIARAAAADPFLAQLCHF